jgi:diguanylate cyclase (GGDEF)-like protein
VNTSHDTHKYSDDPLIPEELVALRALCAQFQANSFMDDLTGLNSYSAWQHLTRQELRRSFREKWSFSLLLVSLDYFQPFHDYHGVLKSDYCINKVAYIIRQMAQRPGDCASRFGFGDFLISLPKTQVEGAVILAQKIRKNVEDLQIRNRFSPISNWLTVSVGVASVAENLESTLESLSTKADSSMQKVRQSGGNQVQSYHKVR